MDRLDRSVTQEARPGRRGPRRAAGARSRPAPAGRRGHPGAGDGPAAARPRAAEPSRRPGDRDGLAAAAAGGTASGEPGPESRRFYQDALRRLDAAGVPVLVGGAYAFERYTGIARHTKDLDVFVRPADRDRALAVLEAAGYRTERTHPHWLAKAYTTDDFIDLIWSSGNGVADVDDAWFAHGVDDVVLGTPARLCPAEEMIWSKAFIMERERYDGGDVAHLIRARGRELAWRRLLRRFGRHWRVLLSHLVLFGFIYPAERTTVPAWVMALLVRRLLRDAADGPARQAVCFGTLLSRQQYLVDVERWGYRDARRPPSGRMTAEHIAQWTAAIHAGPGPTGLGPAGP
jgi:hypothetical protein